MYVYMYVYALTCLHVHCGGGLVHDDDLCFGQQSAGDAEQLSLPHGKIASTFCDHCMYVYMYVCMYVCMYV